MEKIEDLSDCIEQLYQDDIEFTPAEKVIFKAWWEGIERKIA